MEQDLNELGQSIIEIKDELISNHSDVINKALLFQVQTYMEGNLITPAIYRLIEDEEVKREMLINELSLIQSFLKTKEERVKDIIDLADKLTKDFNLNNDIDLIIDEDKESITIKKSIMAPVYKITNLFKVNETDEEKNKVFFIKYVTLRFPKIISNFFEDNKERTKGYYYSNPFNTRSQDAFGIFILKELNLKDMYKEEIQNFIDTSELIKNYFNSNL